MSPPAPPEPRAASNKWIVALAVTFGTLMGAIDASIVNVALPHIRGGLGATIEEITWISTAYLIAMVIVMPLTAFLGSFFGQKRLYMTSLMLFVAGSALCGSARSLTTLTVFRVLQGLGAGALQPTEQAILRQTFGQREAGMAMALFAMAVMVGPAVGPTLGGWITDNYSWPWIFYINLPVGALGLLMVWRFVQEPEDIRAANRARAEAQRGHMDWTGIALLAVTLGSLQYFLEEGERRLWFESPVIQATFAVMLVAFAAFLIRELTAPVPAVNLRLFRERNFVAGTLVGGVMFAMLMSSMFLLPLFMQELLGFSATQSGLTLMPRTLIMIATTPIVGRLYNRVSPAVFIALGVLLVAYGSWDLSRMTLATSSTGIVAALLATGVGFACLFVPLATVALANIPRALLTDATGLNSVVRQVGGSIGLTTFAVLLTRYGAQSQAGLVHHVTPLRPEVVARVALLQQQLGHGLGARGAEPGAFGLLTRIVVGQATVLAYDKVFLLQAIAFVAVLPLVFLLRRGGGDAPAPAARE
ncbi:MAG TPA: DHA2 family efflux MFS transporter permease subunit [Polyangia bacterium]